MFRKKLQLAILLALPFSLFGNEPIDTTKPEKCMSLCGCWTKIELDFVAYVFDSNGNPVEGIALTCKAENVARGISDKNGFISFKLKTEFSPGCQYQSCTNMIFSDEKARYKNVEATIFQSNGKTIVLSNP